MAHYYLLQDRRLYINKFIERLNSGLYYISYYNSHFWYMYNYTTIKSISKEHRMYLETFSQIIYT